jgi:hypothetical protein
MPSRLASPGTQEFGDPRPQPFRPLPKAWAHWRGLYLHGQSVLLSYSVGDMSVLERPELEKSDGITALVRCLNLGPSKEPQSVQLVQEPGRMAFVRTRDGNASAVEQANPNDTWSGWKRR